MATGTHAKRVLGQLWSMAYTAVRPLSHGYSVYGNASQGLTVATSMGAKSEMFLVTTAMPWTKAVAAINASRSGSRVGTWSLAH